MRRGVPTREARDRVQTVLCKVVAAVGPAGLEKPEEWRALACKIAEDEAVDCVRRRATDRKWYTGRTGKPDRYAAQHFSRPDALVEAKQQIGCMRQVLDQDGGHPLARQVAEAQALGHSREEIAGQLGIAQQTVTNIMSAIRRAYQRRWNVEKISWVVAWFLMIVIGMPAIVAHLHAKRDAADTSPDKPDAPAVSQTTQATWQQQKAAGIREAALRLCDQGKYLDCLVGLDEAKDVDPEGDEAADVQEARRTAGDAIHPQQQEGPPPRDNKL